MQKNSHGWLHQSRRYSNAQNTMALQPLQTQYREENDLAKIACFFYIKKKFIG
jgi:hypothetical protein